MPAVWASNQEPGAMTDQELRDKFPEIRWDEPFKVTIAGRGTTYLCRYCIAHEGLKASEAFDKGGILQKIENHIAREHR